MENYKKEPKSQRQGRKIENCKKEPKSQRQGWIKVENTNPGQQGQGTDYDWENQFPGTGRY